MKNRETCLRCSAGEASGAGRSSEGMLLNSSFSRFSYSLFSHFFDPSFSRFLNFLFHRFLIQHWMWISLSPFASSAGPSGSKGWDACGSVPSGAYKLHVFWFSRGVCGIQGLGFCKEMNLSIHIMQLSNGPAYATDAPRLLWSHKWSSGTIPNDHSN